MVFENLADGFSLEGTLALLNEFSWLPEFKIIDFFTENFWDTNSILPARWKDYADGLPDEGFEHNLLQLASTNPVSVTEHTVNAFVSSCYQHCFVRRSSKPFTVPQRRINVSQKKTYEIETLAKVIGNLCDTTQINHAVDVGAGQGYLALELLRTHDHLRVTGIECNDHQVHGSVTRRDESLPFTSNHRFQIRHLKLDSGMLESFESILLGEASLLYSLHACGSLSESMLALFIKCPSANAIFNIGCCYNLIDEDQAGIHFPMSAKLRMAGCTPLSRNMKMVASQAPYRWIENPQQAKEFFSRHYYRGLLEVLLREDTVLHGLETTRLGTVPSSSLSSFESYMERALKNLEITGIDCSRILDLESSTKSYKKRLAFMWTMRALIGMSIEALILFDRYCYLQENLAETSTVKILSILDPMKSPRSVALLAIK